MKLLRVDMETKQVQYEAVPEAYRCLGGRGLVAKILTDEVPPACDPLGKDNKLIVTVGLLAGTTATTAGRISIGGKSPLTKGIKEANSGGLTSTYMTRHGVKTIIVEGMPEDDHLYIVRIDSKGEAHLDEVDDLIGADTYTAVNKLYERFGRDCAISIIGPAGEKLYPVSAIMNTDFATGEPCRASARGGLGAVMGSKRIKAFLIENAEVRSKPDYADEELFKTTAREFAKALLKHPGTANRSKYGSMAVLRPMAENGMLPVKNFRAEVCEGLDQVDANALFDKLEKNGGKHGLVCHPGCVIRSSNTYCNDKGEYITSGLQYETVALCGTNCLIHDLDQIAVISRKCDELGVDTMEIGHALALFMDAGRLEWGDAEGSIRLIDGIGTGEEEGVQLASGIRALSEYLGCDRVAEVNGQTFPSFDPKNNKGFGVVFAVSPQGADHTTATAANEDGSYVASALFQQALTVMIDSSFCMFTIMPFCADMGYFSKLLVKMMKGLYGGQWSWQKIIDIGAEIIGWEKEFNLKAGWSEQVKDLPRRFRDETSPMTGNHFDVPYEQLQEIYDRMGQKVVARD